MASTLDQKQRLAQLRTPLGENRLVLARFTAEEAVSALFEISVEAVSEEADVDFNPVLGRACLVTLETHGGGRRYFHGLLTQARWTGVHDTLHGYQMTLRPWLWLLSQTSNCRLFQDLKVPDIIREVFEGANVSDFEFKLDGTYPSLDYCVQYRETDFAFISRLMEEYGLYYYFRHEQDRHLLVIADSMGSHPTLDGDGTLAFNPLVGGITHPRAHLRRWSSGRRVASGRFSINDYDFERPGAKLEVHREASQTHAGSRLEIYDYPGRYTDRDQGEALAKVRLDAAQSLDHVRHAAGDAPLLAAGLKFTLKDHPSDTENAEYLTLRASHAISEQSYGSGVPTHSMRTEYTGHYVLVPTSRAFRAPQVTPRPVIHGIQTAKVVGDEGDEITVDKYGRIKVQFHWDRQKKPSCWVRVAEVFAGAAWGGVFHPRAGQEVVVDFLEGDPDRPLVVGALYNADNMPPYALPANKTISGWKTSSSKGGGGYNELSFDDRKSAEMIRMHAQKDHEATILHRRKVTIGEKFPSPTGSASDQITVKKGDLQIDVESGLMKISAQMKIELTVGGSTLTLDPSGITLKAPTITLQSDGPCIVKGLPVKIN